MTNTIRMPATSSFAMQAKSAFYLLKDVIDVLQSGNAARPYLKSQEELRALVRSKAKSKAEASIVEEALRHPIRGSTMGISTSLNHEQTVVISTTDDDPESTAIHFARALLSRNPSGKTAVMNFKKVIDGHLYCRVVYEGGVVDYYPEEMADADREVMEAMSMPQLQEMARNALAETGITADENALAFLRPSQIVELVRVIAPQAVPGRFQFPKSENSTPLEIDAGPGPSMEKAK